MPLYTCVCLCLWLNTTGASGSRHASCVPPAQQLHFHLLQLSTFAFLESSFTLTGASPSAHPSPASQCKSLLIFGHNLPLFRPQRAKVCPCPSSTGLLSAAAAGWCLLAPSCGCSSLNQRHKILPHCVFR